MRQIINYIEQGLKMNYEYPEEGRHPSGVEEDL
jgi:hypothetical protein